MLKKLKIGSLPECFPIIQGGMAIRISTAPLAAAVANEGGICIIAGTGMSVEELRNEIRKARNLTNGIIGVNVLYAVSQFASLVKAAIAEKIDLVISGAGISRDMYAWGKNAGVAIVSIVSSARLAKISEKFGAAAVVVEGKEAGGHLGTDRPLREILPEVVGSVNIPVIAAGGIIDALDIKEMLALGADGVQMGTRFAASQESNACQEFKDLYVKADIDDVILVKSPVGLLGRAIHSEFTDSIAGDKERKISKCNECLKQCSKKYCIVEALNNALIGEKFDKALIFAGERVDKIKEILPVKKIFKDILNRL